MAATKLSTQDRKDLEKFTKYLVYKCIQIIVQSRLGEKLRTQSKPYSSGSDWFNLAVRDIPEVLNETKKVLATQSQTLSQTQSVCTEISLKTAEGDTMILETWWLSINDQVDTNARVSYTVYSRMGILLKSLLSVARVTPAYRLSRKQGPDTYVICYRIYLGDPQLNCLGPGCQHARVGSAPTPLGTITLNAAYRTKLLISPQKTCRDLAVDLKDDHFTYRPEYSPKRSSNTTPKPCHLGFKEPRGISEECNGVVDVLDGEACNSTFSTSPPDPFTHPSFYMGHGQFPPNKVSSRIQSPPQRIQQKINGEVEDQYTLNNTAKASSFSQGQKIGAFASAKELNQEQLDDDIPFLSLLQHDKDSIEQKCDETYRHSNSGHTDDISRSDGSSKSSISQTTVDDFVLVELKTPFAATDATSDLGKFYRECQGAPPLGMFEEENTVKDTLSDISDQLLLFENNVREFDDFVNALQATEG